MAYIWSIVRIQLSQKFGSSFRGSVRRVIIIVCAVLVFSSCYIGEVIFSLMDDLDIFSKLPHHTRVDLYVGYVIPQLTPVL